MRRFIVIAYDIEDDKRRRQVVKLLEAVAHRVNKSVFECYLSESTLRKLKISIARRITHDDSVLYYFLCHACIERIERFGAKGLPTELVKIY